MRRPGTFLYVPSTNIQGMCSKRVQEDSGYCLSADAATIAWQRKICKCITWGYFNRWWNAQAQWYIYSAILNYLSRYIYISHTPYQVLNITPIINTGINRKGTYNPSTSVSMNGCVLGRTWYLNKCTVVIFCISSWYQLMIYIRLVVQYVWTILFSSSLILLPEP